MNIKFTFPDTTDLDTMIIEDVKMDILNKLKPLLDEVSLSGRDVEIKITENWSFSVELISDEENLADRINNLLYT